MKLPIARILSILIIFNSSITYGQIEQYNYKREIKGIADQWHKITLPDEVFGKISANLTDIRIFGITADNDTIETPYFFRIATESTNIENVEFETLNTSHNSEGYYFTFEIPTSEAINQIKLDFNNDNFDWRIKLEGSVNQNSWFTVIENYRILSIKNEATDFQFTTLEFPSTKYRFFRLLIHSNEAPELSSASITQQEITNGKFKNYTIKKYTVTENKKNKQTEIDIELQLPVPVCQLKIDVNSSFDYYRPITIKYLADSVNTEQGWKYNYNTLTSGTLNSIVKNEFNFENTTVKQLKIIIQNENNQPLNINSVQVQGYDHELIARFTEQATYFLTYGNSQAADPNYDIDHFANKVPETLIALELGNEQKIDKKEIAAVEPLFKNKTWLWVIMGVIIFVLGWFSVKMMRKG